MGNQWVTIEDAQKLLGVSQRTVYRWIDKGQLASQKRGSKTYVAIDTSQISAESAEIDKELADKLARLEIELNAKNDYIEHLEGEVDYLRNAHAASLSANQSLQKLIESRNQEDAERQKKGKWWRFWQE